VLYEKPFNKFKPRIQRSEKMMFFTRSSESANALAWRRRTVSEIYEVIENLD
jgi:hypothetical protein